MCEGVFCSPVARTSFARRSGGHPRTYRTPAPRRVPALDKSKDRSRLRIEGTSHQLMPGNKVCIDIRVKTGSCKRTKVVVLPVRMFIGFVGTFRCTLCQPRVVNARCAVNALSINL